MTWRVTLQINKAFKYQVSGIFLWNGGSWDVQGIYPESTTTDGSYRDPTLVPLISAHNTLAAQSAGENTNPPHTEMLPYSLEFMRCGGVDFPTLDFGSDSASMAMERGVA